MNDEIIIFKNTNNKKNTKGKFSFKRKQQQRFISTSHMICFWIFSLEKNMIFFRIFFRKIFWQNKPNKTQNMSHRMVDFVVVRFFPWKKTTYNNNHITSLKSFITFVFYSFCHPPTHYTVMKIKETMVV